jgi:hypothetical protein
MSDVLNLSPFGSPIPGPKKKYVFGGEEPQEIEKIKVYPQMKDGAMYLSTDVDSDDFNPESIPGMVPVQPVEEPKEDPTKPDVTKQNLVVAIVLRNLIQIKLLHWQTHSFAEHEAFGDLFSQFDEMTDDLVESIMGKYGRPVLDDATSSFKIENYENPENPDGLHPYLNDLYATFVNQVRNSFHPENDIEIINLIDDVLSMINKIKYLTTLRK